MAEKPLQKPIGRSNEFSGTEGIYLLPHHPNELDRVLQCHGLILSETGDTIIKSPLPAPGAKLRVLDVGCADGSWLGDLAKIKSHHKWDLHGVDIHDTFFPLSGKSSFPLDLRIHDVNTRFPIKWGWDNYFDVVHQRLLIWGIKTENWPTAVQNLLRVVKPGGWVELIEVVWVDKHASINHETQPELATQRVLECWTCDHHGFDIYVADKLENLLEGAGCQNVQRFEYPLGIGAKAREDKWKVISAEMWNVIFRSFEQKMPLEGIPGVAKTPHELHDFLDRLNVEIKEHGYMPKIHYVVGQKPQPVGLLSKLKKLLFCGN